MKIEGIDLSRLRNNEHFELMNQIITIITRSGAVVLKVTRYLDALTDALVSESEAMRKVKKSLITKQIAEMDTLRDKLFRGIVSIIRGSAVHFDPEIRKAAEKLTVVLKAHGPVARRAFDEESTAINIIVKNLTGKYADECALLGISTWLAELKKANKEFQALMVRRIEEGADGAQQLVMKDVRAGVDAAYKTLADVVSAKGFLASIEGEEEEAAQYRSVINRWNEAVERAENIVAMRKGRAAAATRPQ